MSWSWGAVSAGGSAEPGAGRPAVPGATGTAPRDRIVAARSGYRGIPLRGGRRAVGLQVGGRTSAAPPFRGRLFGAAAAAGGEGMRLAFPPPRRGVIPKRCRDCTGFFW